MFDNRVSAWSAGAGRHGLVRAAATFSAIIAALWLCLAATSARADCTEQYTLDNQSATTAASTPVNMAITVSIFCRSGDASIVSGPAHGTVQIGSSLQLTYTPNPGWSGTDTFTIRKYEPDGAFWTNTATYTVTTTAPTRPEGANASLSVPYGGSNSIALPVTGVATSTTIILGPSKGSYSLSGTTITYTAAAGAYGADTMGWYVSGPGGDSNRWTLSINIATPPAPVASDKAVTVDYGSSGNVIAAPVTGIADSVSITFSPLHGSAYISGSNIVYTPSAGYYGGDVVQIQALGPGGSSGVGSVNITVSPPPPPTANGGTITTAYLTQGSLSLAASGVVSSYKVVTQPASGSALISGSTAYYSPNAMFSGADSFTVAAVGPGGQGPPATITANVGLPPPPTALNRSLTSTFNGSGQVTLVATGYATLFSVAQPAHGTVSLAGAAASYVPNVDYYGADSFTYTASGPGGTSNTATVSVTVGLPPAPSADDGTMSVGFEQSGNFTMTGAGIRDGFTIVAGPAHGQLAVTGDVVSYTAGPGYYGADSYTYAARGPGGQGAAARVSVTVGLPPLPIATPQSMSTSFETPGNVSLAGSGVILDYSIAAGPAHGTVALSGAVATYSPQAGFYGVDSFTFTADGPAGSSTPATVSVNVGLPPPPVPRAATLQTAFETAGSVSLAADGVVSLLHIAQHPNHGSVTLTGATATYTPMPGYYGVDGFAFTAEGPGGISQAQNVQVTVGLPPPPTVQAESVTTGYEKPASITLQGGGVRDSFVIVAQPSHGVTSLQGDVATYTPAPGFYGADSFTVAAAGPGGQGAAAIVSVLVATPDAPQAIAGTLTTQFEMPAAVTLGASGVVSSFAIGQQPRHGAVTLSGAVATYAPQAGFYGADAFTFTVAGPGGQSAPAQVSVSVVTPPPLVRDDHMATDADHPVTLDLTSNDRGPISTLEIVAQPQHGSVSIDGFNATYKATPGYAGTDVFTYRAIGEGGVSNVGTVTVDVAPGTLPKVQDFTVTALAGETLLIDVTQGATNAPFQAVFVVGQPANGQAINAGLAVSYTSTRDFAGTVKIGYRLANNFGTSDLATITVKVNPRPITAPEKDVEIWQGQSAVIDLVQGAIGGPFVAAAVKSISPNDAGTAKISTDGKLRLTFAPSGPFKGVVEIRYTLSNAFVESEPGLIKVTVKERPNPARDPEVSGLLNAQAQTALRFSQAQLANVTRRLEMLHGKGVRRSSVGLSLVPMDRLADLPGDNSDMQKLKAYLVDAGLTEPATSRPSSEPVAGRGLSWWVGGAVDLGSNQAKANRAGLRFTTDGISVGADVQPLKSTYAGVGLGYGHDSTKVGDKGTKSNADSLSLFAYATYQPTERTFVDAVVGGSSVSFDAARYVTATGGSLRSKRNGGTVFASLKGGYEHRGPHWHVSPYGGVEYVRSSLSAFSESGDDVWALSYGAQSSTKLTAIAGVHGDYLIRRQHGDLLPTFRAEARQDLQNAGRATMRYADWSDSPVYGLDLAAYAKQSLLLGVGLEWRTRGGAAAGVDYEQVFSDQGPTAAIRFRVSTRF